MTPHQIARLACRLLALFAGVMAVSAIPQAMWPLTVDLPGVTRPVLFHVVQALPVALYSAAALFLWLAADRLASRMAGDADTTTSLPGEASLQSMAFCVVGFCILGWALPGLAQVALSRSLDLLDWRANLASVALQVALGSVLVVGARPLTAWLARPKSWRLVAAFGLVPILAAVMIGTGREADRRVAWSKEAVKVLDGAPPRGGRLLGPTGRYRGHADGSPAVLAESSAVVAGRVLSSRRAARRRQAPAAVERRRHDVGGVGRRRRVPNPRAAWNLYVRRLRAGPRRGRPCPGGYALDR